MVLNPGSSSDPLVPWSDRGGQTATQPARVASSATLEDNLFRGELAAAPTGEAQPPLVSTSAMDESDHAQCVSVTWVPTPFGDVSLPAKRRPCCAASVSSSPTGFGDVAAPLTLALHRAETGRDRNERSGCMAFHAFSDDRQRQELLRALFPTATILVSPKTQLPHAPSRKAYSAMAVVTGDNLGLHGVRAPWRVEGVARHDFQLPPQKQAAEIEREHGIAFA